MGIAYNTSMVRDGLVGHYDAANVKSYPGTGTVWSDISGHSNTVNLINGVGYSDSNRGVLTFDGVNSYCEILSNADNTLGTDDFTIDICFFITDRSGLISKGSGATTGTMLLFISSSNTIRFVVDAYHY